MVSSGWKNMFNKHFIKIEQTTCNCRDENGNGKNQLFWVWINMKCMDNSAQNQLQVANQLYVLISVIDTISDDFLDPLIQKALKTLLECSVFQTDSIKEKFSFKIDKFMKLLFLKHVQ